MPSTPSRSSVANQVSSPARRILNRIASPFGSKSRNIADFEVKPDDPHRQYGPGDAVSGSVRLRVTKPTRVTHLVVRLHGYVQVYKNPSSPGDGYRAHPTYLNTHRGSKSGEYFGNGFASLFEDEVVLCGDGRLAEGSYQFNFELEFPDRDLPSSIEFERGTICYMVTATMTRPTTMSPILTNDHKIYYMERIDVAPLMPPKPRTITLEPVARRLRPKSQAHKLVDPADKRSRGTDSRRSDAHRPSEASSEPSSRADGDAPISPELSVVSFHSAGSGGDQVSPRGSNNRPSPSASDAAATRSSTGKASSTFKVITALVESQTGGCLRGDTIPIKVSVTHTKQIKSLHGVIVTLYRIARVDMRPSIPLGPTEKGKDVKFEEYYPKSVTGLGGLSLSGAGSTHVFRKDLSQTMSPLYVDPHTLTAEINTRVRIPEDVFPSISTVPGQMISFKYYVEVILDIQGRLAGQVTAPVALNGSTNVEHGENERSAFSPFGPAIIDTTATRRDKSVVTCSFELVIGTQDSERKKGKRKQVDIMPSVPQEVPQSMEDLPTQQEIASYDAWQYDEAGYEWYDAAGYHDPRWYPHHHHYYHHEQPIPENPPSINDHPPPPLILPPEQQDQSQLSEKERIRQAETRLLPSKPPGDGPEQAAGASSSSAPTAPYLQGEAGFEHALTSWSSVHDALPVPSPSAPVGTQAPTTVVDSADFPSAPLYEPPSDSSLHSVVPSATDDKQEMQRRQLHAQASAPPLEDHETDGMEGSASHAIVPSAPTTDGADESMADTNDSHADAVESPSLPRYER